jgi:hypothetical protein
LSPTNDPNTATIQGILRNGPGLSGSKLALVNIKLRVRPGVLPGVYLKAVYLTSAYSLTPVAQLSSIFADGPSHYDFTGAESDGIAVQIAQPQVLGLLLANEHSPIFDLNPAQGATTMHDATLNIFTCVISHYYQHSLLQAVSCVMIHNHKLKYTAPHASCTMLHAQPPALPNFLMVHCLTMSNWARRLRSS